MRGRFEEVESSSFTSSKRRRRNDDDGDSQSRKKHLYLALDDWDGGYNIHKLDADDILDQDSGGGGEDELPEPAAVRMASPDCGPMAFAAVGANIFAATNLRRRGDRAPPTIVYNTRTAALAIGPRVPDWIYDLGDAMAVGDKLYALTSVPFRMSSSLQALKWVKMKTVIPDPQPFDPTREWCWKTVPSPEPPPCNGIEIIAYAVHPDARTVFISTGICTYTLDTSNGTWKELGEWVLPFRGQFFFDSGLDAWVGLHRQHDGWVCCCHATSLSASTTRQPECKMLMEKLVRRNEEDPQHWSCLRGKATSLTYMGDSRFAFFENVLRGEHVNSGAVIHITLFGLKYDHKGELKTKVHHRATRSYTVSKNTHMFCHAAFWM